MCNLSLNPVEFDTRFTIHQFEHLSLQGPGKFSYEKDWKIGEGLASTVYMCKDSNGIDLLAVKSMLKKLCPKAEEELNTLRSFGSSKYLLNYVSSEHTEDGLLDVWTELCEGDVDKFIKCCQCKCEGKSSSEWPKRLSKTVEEFNEHGVHSKQHYLSYFNGLSTMNIAKQMVEGIFKLHSLKYVHRDIKPSNFLLQKQPNETSEIYVKTCDFGLTRRMDTKLSTKPSGTASFKPPEVLKCISTLIPDAKSDVFVLGLTLFFTITEGNHPFGDDITDQDYNIKKNNGPNFKDLNDMQLDEEIKINWCGLLQWMLQHDPKNRPTMKEVKCHPALWSYEEKIMFIEVVANLTDEYRAQEKKQIKKVKKEDRKKKALAKKANPGQQAKKQNEEVKDKKDCKLVAATGDELEAEESVNRNSTQNDGAVTFSEPSTSQKQEAEPIDISASNNQQASVPLAANRPRETQPCSFFYINEVVDIDKRVEKLKEVFDPVNAPSSPVWKKINDTRNLNQHERLLGRKPEIGLGEKTDWKMFYEHCTKGCPDLLLWLYALFGNMEQSENFMENVLQKDRG
uniref:Serine/threonine-protein kinase/endoribonuclease IRE2-like n=1 Tax=Phallusia mammillata TaxID=59560 RepID=A0A6F9DBJ8_9ASCI|nr:serine/threonine-protein kinase/endoribonuclease IRE2-like [Phallusia mammillata]